MCVFRAIENDVGIARAANTGVSCLIDPTGQIHQATPLFEPAVVTGSVRLAGPPTFYTRYGDWILAVAGLVVVVAIAGPAWEAGKFLSARNRQRAGATGNE
jgi:apolipoprotein N-acyltransferase